MSLTSHTWDELASSVNQYEDGDFLAVSSWIGFLGQLAPELAEAPREKALALASRLTQALQSGALDGLTGWVGAELDALASEPAPEADLWSQHGAAFISETRNRLARAEEITLLLEDCADPQLVNELFRVFHTIKGEAGFLHREDLSVAAHRTEELLEQLRSGQTRWDEGVADRVLAGIDDLKRATGAPRGQARAASEEVLRVPAAKIDALIAQIGELLIAQESQSDPGSSGVRKLGRALQQSALKLRTEPLADLMNRLKRGARDLAKSLGKQVEVALVGTELELDRTLIATLEEP